MVLSHVPQCWVHAESEGRSGLEEVSTWFLHLRLPGKDALNVAEKLALFHCIFLFIFWGIQPSQAFPEEAERAGIMTRCDCRMRFFDLVCYIWHKIPRF